MDRKSWRFVDTRGESNKIFHKINMTAHFKALANIKPRISLNTPPKKFMENLKNRDKAFVKAALAKIPLEVKFNEKLAKNTEYKEAREAIKRVQSAKPTSNFL